MVARQARDLDVRVRVQVHVQIFLLKFDKQVTFDKSMNTNIYRIFLVFFPQVYEYTRIFLVIVTQSAGSSRISFLLLRCCDIS